MMGNGGYEDENNEWNDNDDDDDEDAGKHILE